MEHQTLPSSARRFLLTAISLSAFVISAVCVLAPASARADYRDIRKLEQAHDSLVRMEGNLLDRRREITNALRAQSEGSALLVEHDDGSIAAVPRANLRDMIGMAYDVAQYIALDERVRPFLPDDLRTLLDQGLSAALARVMAVDRGIALLEARQSNLRAELIARRAAIDALLERVRKTATDVIAERDAKKAQRDAEGLIDGSVCFHDTQPTDGFATVASLGYGGGDYPVKGRFICTGFAGFLWDSGVSIREYRCSDRNARPPVCSLFSEMTYERTAHPETGNTVYNLEDQRTWITFHFK